MLVAGVEQCDSCMQSLLFSRWGQPVRVMWGYLLLQVCIWGLHFCLLYGIAGCPLFRGF